jgi:protein SCO1/2
LQANEDENDEDEYLVDHSIVLYFLSPTGEFLDFFTQKTQVSDVVRKIKEFVAQEKTKQ